jgi:hypothetical protein
MVYLTVSIGNVSITTVAFAGPVKVLLVPLLERTLLASLKASFTFDSTAAWSADNCLIEVESKFSVVASFLHAFVIKPKILIVLSYLFDI